jgi:hypothetical protein
MQVYSNPDRERDPTALPDVEVFQLTAAEVAELDDDMLYEYAQKHRFRAASISPRVREQMIDAMIADNGIEGGWFYHACFPGCLPDGPPIGPYPTANDAKKAAQEQD